MAVNQYRATAGLGFGTRPNDRMTSRRHHLNLQTNRFQFLSQPFSALIYFTGTGRVSGHAGKPEKGKVFVEVTLAHEWRLNQLSSVRLSNGQPSIKKAAHEIECGSN